MHTKILITGVNGFVGQHVAKQLHSQDLEIIGVGEQPVLTENLKNLACEYVSCDLTDQSQVSKIDLKNVAAIINLAGFAKVGGSAGQGELYNRVNVGVHTVLYEECLAQGVSPRIIAVSTGAVYDPNQPLPITENSKLAAEDQTNEYVISKIKMEASLKYFKDKGLHIVIVRPFNHSGPGQLPGFLIPDLGEQISQAAHDNKPLLVGNLDTKRDYTDVRDVARAYVELATCDKTKLNHSLYNVCSGKSIPGSEVLRMLTDAFGSPDIETAVDQSKIRPQDVMDIFGSNSRIHQDIGWVPQISVEQMINDYADWKKSQ